MNKTTYTIIYVMAILLLTSCVKQQKEEKVDSSKENQKNKETTNVEKQAVKQHVEYKSVIIGKQTWMAENLDVKHFRNGDTIPHAETADEWDEAAKAKAPAWCYYNNDEKNGDKYGKLYNWYAVNDSRGLAPEGWKVPSKEDFDQLINHVGVLAGNADKLMSRKGWIYESGSNETGFNALPSGGRFFTDDFEVKGEYAYFWSSENDKIKYDNIDKAYLFVLMGIFSGISSYPKRYGLSVRCIKAEKE